MNTAELKAFLDEKAAFYEHPNFIENDPIQIPHSFKHKEDIEISGFLTATIAWGNRKSIIKNSSRLMTLMGDSPYDFIMHCSNEQREALMGFVHRTFNGIDLIYFTKALLKKGTFSDGLVGLTIVTGVSKRTVWIMTMIATTVMMMTVGHFGKIVLMQEFTRIPLHAQTTQPMTTDGCS